MSINEAGEWFDQTRKVGGGYSLVTPAGFRYTIDANADVIASITDRNDNTLTITGDAITSSTGKARRVKKVERAEKHAGMQVHMRDAGRISVDESGGGWSEWLG